MLRGNIKRSAGQSLPGIPAWWADNWRQASAALADVWWVFTECFFSSFLWVLCACLGALEGKTQELSLLSSTAPPLKPATGANGWPSIRVKAECGSKHYIQTRYLNPACGIWCLRSESQSFWASKHVIYYIFLLFFLSFLLRVFYAYFSCKKKHPGNYWALLSEGWPQVWIKVTALSVKRIVITKTLRNFPSTLSPHCKRRNARLGFLVFLPIHHWVSKTEMPGSSAQPSPGWASTQGARGQGLLEGRRLGGCWVWEIVSQKGKWGGGKRHADRVLKTKEWNSALPCFCWVPGVNADSIKLLFFLFTQEGSTDVSESRPAVSLFSSC